MTTVSEFRAIVKHYGRNGTTACSICGAVPNKSMVLCFYPNHDQDEVGKFWKNNRNKGGWSGRTIHICTSCAGRMVYIATRPADANGNDLMWSVPEEEQTT